MDWRRGSQDGLVELKGQGSQSAERELAYTPAGPWTDPPLQEVDPFNLWERGGSMAVELFPMGVTRQDATDATTTHWHVLD